MKNPFKRSDFELVLWVLTAFMALILFGLVCLVSGCSQTPMTSVQPGIVYQYDLSVKVNGQEFIGVGVIPQAKSYDMKIESEDSVDLLTVSSCHRDFSAQAVISQGWFKEKKGYDYIFNPSPNFEDNGSCLVRVGMYSKDVGGQIGWAVLDIQNSDTILPAENICNGSDVKIGGVSICQSKASLIQALKFDVPVNVAIDKLDARCVGKLSADAMTWTYNISQGECVIEFREVQAPHRKHRHTTVGYNQTFIRTGQ